jgi:hypothetical protein
MKTNIREAEIMFYSNRYRTGRGWWQFVSDNELKVGNICLFQLMETKKLKMDVLDRCHCCSWWWICKMPTLLSWNCLVYKHQLETLNVTNFKEPPNVPFGFKSKMEMEHPLAAPDLSMFSLS